jgi:hypothetical protein
LLNLHIASFSESCQGVKSRFPNTKEAVKCFESKQNQGALQTPDFRLQTPDEKPVPRRTPVLPESPAMLFLPGNPSAGPDSDPE